MLSLRWDSTEGGGDHDDILTFTTAEDKRECITISLAERRPAAVQGVVYSCLQRMSTTSFMHHVAKSYYVEPVLRSQEDGKTSPRAGAFRRSRDEHGVVGERKDNRGGHEQSIAVGARDRVLKAWYERQRTLSCECSSKRTCNLAEW